MVVTDSVIDFWSVIDIQERQPTRLFLPLTHRWVGTRQNAVPVQGHVTTRFVTLPEPSLNTWHAPAQGSS